MPELKVTQRRPPQKSRPVFTGRSCAACLDGATAQLDLGRHTRRAFPWDSNSARRLPPSSRAARRVIWEAEKRDARFARLDLVLETAFAVAFSPHVSRRAARPGKGVSARTVRVPWQRTLCVLCQVEFRSRLARTGSAGLPLQRRGETPGRPSFAYFSWPRKKST